MQATGKQVEFSRIYISPALAIRIPFAAPSVLPLLTFNCTQPDINNVRAGRPSPACSVSFFHRFHTEPEYLVRFTRRSGA